MAQHGGGGSGGTKLPTTSKRASAGKKRSQMDRYRGRREHERKFPVSPGQFGVQTKTKQAKEPPTSRKTSARTAAAKETRVVRGQMQREAFRMSRKRDAAKKASRNETPTKEMATVQGSLASAASHKQEKLNQQVALVSAADALKRRNGVRPLLDNLPTYPVEMPSSTFREKIREDNLRRMKESREFLQESIRQFVGLV